MNIPATDHLYPIMKYFDPDERGIFRMTPARMVWGGKKLMQILCSDLHISQIKTLMKGHLKRETVPQITSTEITGYKAALHSDYKRVVFTVITYFDLSSPLSIGGKCF